MQFRDESTQEGSVPVTAHGPVVLLRLNPAALFCRPPNSASCVESMNPPKRYCCQPRPKAERLRQALLVLAWKTPVSCCPSWSDAPIRSDQPTWYDYVLHLFFFCLFRKQVLDKKNGPEPVRRKAEFADPCVIFSVCICM